MWLKVDTSLVYSTYLTKSSSCFVLHDLPCEAQDLRSMTSHSTVVPACVTRRHAKHSKCISLHGQSTQTSVMALCYPSFLLKHIIRCVTKPAQRIIAPAPAMMLRSCVTWPGVALALCYTTCPANRNSSIPTRQAVNPTYLQPELIELIGAEKPSHLQHGLHAYEEADDWRTWFKCLEDGLSLVSDYWVPIPPTLTFKPLSGTWFCLLSGKAINFDFVMNKRGMLCSSIEMCNIPMYFIVFPWAVIFCDD